jgi:formylglycine-generating enzyme required for sulfatase activity
MTVFEITWADYLQAVHEAGCAKPVNNDPRYTDIDVAADEYSDNYPITGVSAVDFKCYISWLNRKSGKTYRFPSSKEWLEAARYAPAKPAYLTISADDQLKDPRYVVNRLWVHRTGLGVPSPDGIYDLEGNAAEFLSDRRADAKARCVKLKYLDCFQLAVIGKYALLPTPSGFVPADYRDIGWANESDPSVPWGFRLVRD